MKIYGTLTWLTTVHVEPEAHEVAREYPVLAHWPYLATEPAEEPAELEAAGALLEATGVVGPAAGAELDAAGGAAPVAPAGSVVGTVAGWSAVFQVAVVGQAVVATAGEVVP